MPLLSFHVNVAARAAQRIRSKGPQEYLGHFLLGATAPDRRNMTGQDREETHYFNLSQDGEGASGVEMFHSHPDLRDLENLNWDARSFIAGYLSHLVADEMWIVRIYRPYFGNQDSLGGEVDHLLLDRALQYRLNIQAQSDEAKIVGWRDSISSVTRIPDLSLLTWETAEKWKDLVVEIMQRGTEWEGFQRFGRRFVSDAGLREGYLSKIIVDPEGTFDRIHGQLPRSVVAEYEEGCVEETIRVVEEYLL